MLEHLPELEEDLQRFRDLIVLGDLNVDLEKPRSSRSQRIPDLLAEYGLIDLVSKNHLVTRTIKTEKLSHIILLKHSSPQLFFVQYQFPPK